MYNCWNEAVEYLKKTLGTIDMPTSYTKGRATKKCKIYRVEKIKPNTDEAIIHCLLGQYSYGIAAQRELYYKLIELNVIVEEEVF